MRLILTAALLGFGFAAFAQQAPSHVPDCPPAESSAKKQPAGEEVRTLPEERSAILPATPQNIQSAAPTVQQDGTPVVSDATCPGAESPKPKS